MNGPRRQRGVALLIALLAVALAVVLIASLLDRGELAYARTRNAVRAEQAAAYAEGLEAYAAQVLMRDSESDPGLDTFVDVWAVPLPPQEVPAGQISARMTDLNGCFNLNNLLPDSPHAGVWRKRMENLLIALELDPSLAGAMIDWLDDDTSVDSEGGAEDNVYLAQPIPYRTANRMFVHVSELRLVRGIGNEVFARLVAEVCALPPGTSINLNTASTAVLMSLDSRITEVMAQRIRQNGQARWTGVVTALQELADQGVEIDPANRIDLGVTSNYFLARGEVSLDDVPFGFSSLLDECRRYRGGGMYASSVASRCD